MAPEESKRGRLFQQKFPHSEPTTKRLWLVGED